ncbi:MAG: hypothetical protein M3389_12765 [Actinomycetota bacterium]|nr:hypothetical protein [Actinomycetota bacterium]
MCADSRTAGEHAIARATDRQRRLAGKRDRRIGRERAVPHAASPAGGIPATAAIALSVKAVPS